jgi:hypothetical protein
MFSITELDEILMGLDNQIKLLRELVEYGMHEYTFRLDTVLKLREKFETLYFEAKHGHKHERRRRVGTKKPRRNKDVVAKHASDGVSTCDPSAWR